jgi:excisionase family DNA binding protein
VWNGTVIVPRGFTGRFWASRIADMRTVTGDNRVRPLMPVPEAAEMLSVSVRFVRTLIQRRAIPVVRLGRRVLVRRTDVDKIVAKGGL